MAARCPGEAQDPGRRDVLSQMSTTEVLPCPILSPTPLSSPLPMRPCCSCRACWRPHAAPAAPAEAGAPGLRGALLAARAAGHTHVRVDGTLIRTDRCHVPGPTARADGSGRRVDLWWSGKHAAHGGNVQVVTTPGGWPIWTSPVRPGREHDTTALRAHPEALPLLTEWTDAEH